MNVEKLTCFYANSATVSMPALLGEMAQIYADDAGDERAWLPLLRKVCAIFCRRNGATGPYRRAPALALTLLALCHIFLTA